jgi:hypothetical protein
MQPNLSPADNDPHDVLEIAPDVVLVARAEEELSRLARNAKNRSGQPKIEPPSLKMDTAVAPGDVPLVDTSFRAARTDEGPSIGRRIARAFFGLLLAVCVGGAAIAWRASGEVAKDAIATWAPQFAAKSSSTADPSPPSQDAEPAAAASQQSATAAPATTPDTTVPPATTPAATALAATAAAAIPQAATAPADSAQQLQSMARDLANLGQEVAVLKASLAELKASNEQMSRDLAKASEPRQKVSALPTRAAVPPARKPASTFRPTQTAAPYPPPAAPYPPQASSYPPPPAYPPQTAYVPPAAPVQQPVDPDIPRPPMPVRSGSPE